MAISFSGASHAYRGTSDINFFLNDANALTVTIDTERLHIRSVGANEEDINNYATLFGDPESCADMLQERLKPGKV